MGWKQGVTGMGIMRRRIRHNDGHYHHCHTTPNCHHEQLLAGWKQGAEIGMTRSSRHEDNSHDNMDRG
jgi:hypothetical protein